MLSISRLGNDTLAAADPAVYDLQMQVNRYAERVGFSPIDTDGVMGGHTRDAVALIANYFKKQSTTPPSPMYLDIVKDSSYVDQYIAQLTSDLMATADATGMPSEKTTNTSPGSSGGSGSGSGTPSGNVQKQSAGQQSAAGGGGDTIYWIIGGVAAAALVGVGFLMWKKYSKSGKSVSVPTTRRRAYAR